jgi:alpha-galactosidase
MAVIPYARFECGDMVVIYELDEISRVMGLLLAPTAMQSRFATRRETLKDGPEYDALPGWPMPAWGVDPLVQVKWVGAEPPNGFAQGRTMRNGPASFAFQFERQDVQRSDAEMSVVTRARAAQGYRLEHCLTWRTGDPFVTVSTIFYNDAQEPVTLELLSSFNLSGISPFAADDAPEQLRLHRFRSAWSAEGRLETHTLEDLHLERSWTGHGIRSERFGQVGSMPTNGFFPCMVLEDSEAQVMWGAQLAWAGSWQMEVFRRDDRVSLSGGLADREFGHWMKTLAPGESLSTPFAILSTAAGTLDDICQRLTAAQQRAADSAPAVEADLPVIFNEWCTSWGRPSHDNMLAIARRLQGSPVRYLVIDAGWYAPLNGEWSSAQGDWTPNSTLYPAGLAATAQAIRDCGLIPGLWFEMEVAGQTAEAYQQTDHLLCRDGLTLTLSGRRFWNMRDPWVVEYLSQRVIGLLRDTGMGYLKVDYNETLGLGVDGAESLGEGLRQHILGVYDFFARIRATLPDLVIENCSSGGHRLEPSMMALCSMGSFSDAHETREIPIIAANLHRLILPQQSQIWAVLRKTDSDRRLVYLLTSTFLGRMCLSGDILELSDAQWRLALDAQHLYARVAHLIQRGRSRRFGPTVASYRHPRGWQAVLRVSADGREALVAAHSFGADVPASVDIPLEDSAWAIEGSFAGPDNTTSVQGSALHIAFAGEYDSCAVYLRR